MDTNQSKDEIGFYYSEAFSADGIPNPLNFSNL
jgi:hypothetical protein